MGSRDQYEGVHGLSIGDTLRPLGHRRAVQAEPKEGTARGTRSARPSAGPGSQLGTFVESPPRATSSEHAERFQGARRRRVALPVLGERYLRFATAIARR